MLDKKMAYYIRLSVEDGDLKGKEGQRESNSISNQRALLSDYFQTHSELHDYQIIEFCDDGYSGTNFRRPGFIQMMEQIKNGQLHGVMVKDLSRFGREYLEVGAYLELILPLYGVRFISVNDGFDSDRYIGTTGGMELALHNLINGMYSKDLSVKVKTAIQARNRQGKYCGGQAFYGYKLHPKDKHRLIVDESTREIVELIYKLCIQGMSTMQIAKYLNSQGIPSPAQYKKQQGVCYNGRVLQEDIAWIGGTVRKILNDERYTGKMVSGKRESDGIRSKKTRSIPKDQWIVVDGTHEAIISEETFVAAREALRSRIRTVNHNTSGIRSHNIFVCGYCGRKLQKSHGKETHLFCIQARSNDCPDCKAIHENLEGLQNKTLAAVKMHADLFLDQAAFVRKNISTKQKQCHDEIKRAKQKIQSIVSGKRTLYEEYRSGKYSSEAYKRIQKERACEVERLEQQIESLKEKLKERANKQKEIRFSEEQSENLLSLKTYQPEIICRLVDSVRVFADGKIQLILKNKDVFQHVIEILDRQI